MSTSLREIAFEFCNNRSERNFTKLYSRMRPGVFMYVKKILPDIDDIEDVVSVTFANVWSKIDQYDPYYQFSTWVYSIAKNEALQLIRSKHRKHTTSFDAMVATNAFADKHIASYEINDTFESRDTNNAILYSAAIEKIQKLPTKYLQALTLREIEGKKYQEISDELGWNIKTTKTRIRKGRQLVASELTKKYQNILTD